MSIQAPGGWHGYVTAGFPIPMRGNEEEAGGAAVLDLDSFRSP